MTFFPLTLAVLIKYAASLPPDEIIVTGHVAT
jgi:hypothetical protein